MLLADDILAQPEAFRHLAERGPSRWDVALGKMGDLSRFRRVVFTGMGSSYVASVVAAGALMADGIPATAELASTLLHYGRGRLGPDDLLVATSQSGESVEIVKLLDNLVGRPVVGVTCHGDSPLGQRAAAVMGLDVPLDHGVAIKTFGASLMALLYLAARVADAGGKSRGRVAAWTEGAMPVARAVATANDQGQVWVALGREFISHPAAVVTSRGPSLGAAMAGALLFNEVAKVPAWAEEGGEFRHGMIEVAQPGFLAGVVIPGGPGAELEASLAAELAGTGARVIAVAPESGRASVIACADSVAKAQGATGPGWVTVLTVADLDAAFLPIVQTVPFQWLSLGWAEAGGFEPGHFRNMLGVVRTEGQMPLHTSLGR